MDAALKPPGMDLRRVSGGLPPAEARAGKFKAGSIDQEYVRNAGSNTTAGYENLGGNKQETKHDRHPD